MTTLAPISVVVPTRNRRDPLARMIASLARQSPQPSELIVVDSSPDTDTKILCESRHDGLATRIRWHKAEQNGAAAQRNQGVKLAGQELILFVDDDVLFEPNCIDRLLQSLNSDSRLGGVSSMIVNQRYQSPGLASRCLFRVLNGKHEYSYAGKCIGPALNLLPEDSPALPETVLVDWLNTTCTLYRRQALPDPPFPRHFTGYSLMEDVSLSLEVGRNWKLGNARTARIYHDSQIADYKEDKSGLAKMRLINRHFVMTRLLERNRLTDYAKLGLLQTFEIVAGLTHADGWKFLPAVLVGNLRGLYSILSDHRPKSEPESALKNRSQVSPEAAHR